MPGAVRTVAFFVLWLVIHGAGAAGLLVGALTAIVAAWLSLRLLPPVAGHLSVAELFRIILRFPRQSLVAGLDVALRALNPRLPLAPGIVPCPTTLPDGPGRDAFHAYMSLQPGTLPVAMRSESELLVHALDTGQPVAAAFAVEEAAVRRLTEPRGDD